MNDYSNGIEANVLQLCFLFVTNINCKEVLRDEKTILKYISENWTVKMWN